MTAKMYKIWLFVLVGALALSLFGAAITYGRYGSNPSISEDSLYGDIIDFIGAEKYIVRTPEELTAAIENGYSYIEIAEDAEQPFEVTTGVTDVEANLVIDINGNDVIRNSRNPLLNVQENVSVVIVFDSESNTATAGSFYNPVGSSLQVAGGTLTIAAGTYDCGPREGEKVTVSGSNYSTTGGGSFALNDTQSVKSVTLTLHLRNGYGDYSSTNLRQTGYTTATANMPVITPNTTGGRFKARRRAITPISRATPSSCTASATSPTRSRCATPPRATSITATPSAMIITTIMQTAPATRSFTAITT